MSEPVSEPDENNVDETLNEVPIHSVSIVWDLEQDEISWSTWPEDMSIFHLYGLLTTVMMMVQRDLNLYGNTSGSV